MAKIRCMLLGGLALLFIGSNHAAAFNGRFGLWPSSSSWSAYYYVPMQVYYCPPVTVAPMSGPGKIYANPLAAPPSQTSEPPLYQPFMPPAKVSNDDRDRAPMIATSRSQSAGSARDALCRVGFWNLSGRDMTLTVEGKKWLLPKDRAITLEAARTFAWQIDGRTQRVERVAETEVTHEVVIRE